jgi:hypothetical protein
VLRSPVPQPGRLHVVALVRVGGDPADAALAGGSLWIGDTNGGLTRIDPRNRRIIGRVPTGGDVWAVAAGGSGELWVARLENRNFPHNTTTLLGIDPRTGRVLARIPTRTNAGDVKISGNAVWFQDARRGTLSRLDTARATVTTRIPAATSALLAGTARTLWSLSASGTLSEIDTASHRIVNRVTHVVPVISSQNEAGRPALAADATGAWISDPDAGTVARVEDGRIVRRIAVGAGAGPLATGAGAVWVTYGDYPRNRFAVARIDPRDGRITATVALGNHRPKTLLPVGDALWVITTDGTALIIRP